MRLSAICLAITRPGGAGAGVFNPAVLWPLGAASPGLWIDPSTTTASYQDSAGTTALSAIGTVLDSANPVGLMLDRKGNLELGPEGVTNGDFSAGTANWTALLGAVLTVTAGVAKVEGVNGQSFSGIRQDTSISTVPGRFVKIAFTVTELSAGAQAFVYCTNGGGTVVISKYITVPGSYVEYAPQGAVSGTGHLLLDFYVRNNYGAAVTGDYIRVDNISVREIPGIHLSQATSAARPVASARVNLLTYSEDFSNGVWVKTRLTVASGASDPLGGTTATTLTATGIDGILYQGVAVPIGGVVSVFVKRRTGTGLIKLYNGVTLVTIAVDNTWKSFSLAHAAAATGYFQIDLFDSGDAVDIWHPQLNLGPTALPYQRVTSDSDYDASVAPVYSKFDGVDDSWTSVTFTANTVLTSGMTCLMAVRRDSAAACVAGLYETYGGSKYFGALSVSGVSTNSAGAGSPFVYVNKVAVSGGSYVTEADLFAALTPGSWHILEFRGLDLSAWTALQFGNYGGVYRTNGALGEIQLFASGQDANRDRARAQMAAYFGVTLP